MNYYLFLPGIDWLVAEVSSMNYGESSAISQSYKPGEKRRLNRLIDWHLTVIQIAFGNRIDKSADFSKLPITQGEVK